MPVMNIKREMGIEGDIAWLLSAAEFPDLLDLVYRSHFGEIWLFNNDLKVILDEKYFPNIYLDKISNTLKNNILSVKILVSEEAAPHLNSKAGGLSADLADKALRIKKAGGDARLQTIYFGSAKEARNRFPVLNVIPKRHSWVFYVHRADIRSPNHGVVIVRPTEFPFLETARDEHYAIAWQMQRDHLLRRKMQEAFNDCFTKTKDLFSYVSIRKSGECILKKEWSKFGKSAHSKLQTPSSHDPLAFGEDAGAVVLASRNDELFMIKELIRNRLKTTVQPVVAPQGYAGVECANIPTKSGKRLKVLFADVGEGILQAGIRTHEILARWNPSHVILCGVAGVDINADKPLNIGDVVFSESVVNYEDGTVSEVDKKAGKGNSVPSRSIKSESRGWKFDHRSDRSSWPAGTGLFGPADSVTKIFKPTKRELIKMGIVFSEVEKKGLIIADKFKARATVIGSGQKVVASPQYFSDDLRKISKKIDVVETEAAGVCFACALANPLRKALVVRGIMDKTDGKSRAGSIREKTREIANASCSLFLLLLLQRLDA